MYKVFDGKNWFSFNTYIQLIAWLSQYTSSFGSEHYNRILDSTGNNDNDTRYTWVHGTTVSCPTYEKRNCRIINDDGNSIYDSKLIQDVYSFKGDAREILNRMYKENRKKNENKYHYYRGTCLDIPKSAYPDFRRGPYPFIHRRRYGGWLRRISTINEKRMSADPEMKEFNRGSRGNNLPSTWDDIGRDWRDDGWKSQSKNRHQWENRVKAHSNHKYGKGVYVVKDSKKYNDIEIESYNDEDFDDIA